MNTDSLFVKGHPQIKFVLALLFSFFTFALPAEINFAPSNEIARKLKWRYDGHVFTTDLKFSKADYNYYHGLSKVQPYSSYATEHASHNYLLSLAAQLDADAKKLGYKKRSLVEYLTAFVQQAIPYVKDPKGLGHDYPKYPIETIVDRGGDCEDKSALLASLLNTFGFDAKLVALPGHMAVAFWSDRNGVYFYNHEGKKYCYIETTGLWKIGTAPAKFKKVKAKLLDTPHPPKYYRYETISILELNSKETPVLEMPVGEQANQGLIVNGEARVPSFKLRSFRKLIC